MSISSHEQYSKRSLYRNNYLNTKYIWFIEDYYYFHIDLVSFECFADIYIATFVLANVIIKFVVT